MGENDQTGKPVSPTEQPNQWTGAGQYVPAAQPIPAAPTNPKDTGFAGWAVLGFFLPLVGLILWLVWEDTRPMDSQKAKTGCIVGFATSLALCILPFVLLGCVGTAAIVAG